MARKAQKQANVPSLRGMKMALRRRMGLGNALFAILWEHIEADLITEPGQGCDDAEVWQHLLDAAEANAAFREAMALGTEKGRRERVYPQGEAMLAEAEKGRFIAFDLSPHQERCKRAINAYYAARARDDDTVTAFRARFFGGRDLTHDEAEVWLASSRKNSAYEQLRGIARSLMRDFGWRQSSEVEWFILTGRPPTPSAIEVSISSHAVTDARDSLDDGSDGENFRRRARANYGKRIPVSQDHYFVRNTITITVAPWVSREKVAEAYEQAQADADARNGLLRSRRLSERSLAVFEFVTKEGGYRGTGVSSQAMLEQWNKDHREWTYGHRTDFYKTYIRAKGALILSANDTRAQALYRMVLDSHPDSQEEQ